MKSAWLGWWRAMGGWRWLNGALVLTALVMSVVYGLTLVGWTDHGRRQLAGRDISLATHGMLMAGTPARIRISAPVDLDRNLDLQVNGVQQAVIGRDLFQGGQPWLEMDVLLPDEPGVPVLLSLSDGGGNVSWNLGSLYR